MEEMQSEMNIKLSALMVKFEMLEASLIAVTREKEALRGMVTEQASEIAVLRNSLNEREQYARNWSMHIHNISVPTEQETDTRFVMQSVYDALIYPILEGAKNKGDIDHVPDCNTLLETAHILPGKADSHKPISGAAKAAKMSFPFFEDLTKATFQKLTSIKQQTNVISAWTVNGSIRFKIKDNNTIFRVNSLQETFEEIIS